MSENRLSESPVLTKEERLREMVIAHLVGRNQRNLEKNIHELLDTEGGFVERFMFFVPMLDEAAKDRILISGCSAGSEFVVAKRFGFKAAAGVEIHQSLVDICRVRLEDDPDCEVAIYDGKKLPYSDGEFGTIYSGHVIEHTPEPFEYFREHFRVLRPGGFFFIEFPNRYHHTELHTGQQSFEWLPLPLRNAALDIMSTSLVTRDKRKRELYSIVRKTLKPISASLIEQYARKLGSRSTRIIATQVPAPGFMRVLLQR